MRGFSPSKINGSLASAIVDKPGINNAEPISDCLINFLLCDIRANLESGLKLLKIALF